MRTYLVTGGAGFIGSNYIHYMFEKYGDEQERLFGILIKKDSDEYLIGKSDTCSCSVDSSFEELEKTDSEFYKTIEKIVKEKIIE